MTQNEVYRLSELEKLIGDSINEIIYVEINYGNPSWDMDDHHSLDYGLELHTENGQRFYFTWGKQKLQFDLLIKNGNISEIFSKEANVSTYDLSTNENWNKIIGVKIVDFEPIYSWAETNGSTTDYLQDLKIQFENGETLLISVSEFIDGQMIGMQDHISVFFAEDTAKSYGIGVKNEL